MAPSEWRQLREIRLRALRDAPNAFGSAYGEEEGQPGEWWRESLATFAWFVAATPGDVVGLAAGMPPEPERNAVNLISMWVAPAWRGVGVADRLVGAVVQWAATTGVDEVRLRVAEGNERARRFYQRLGFENTGDLKPLRSNPGICVEEMRLHLGAPPVPSPSGET